MSDLISRSALLESLIYCQGLGRKSCELVVTTINNQPAVSEQEIRNKAIDEFAEAIKSTLPIAVHKDCSEIDYEVDYALYGLRNRIDRIAEQMKEVGE